MTKKKSASKTPAHFYKYATVERRDILEGNQIRFTQPKYLNDLFDVQPTVQQISSDKDIAKQAKLFASHPKIVEVAKRFRDEELQRQLAFYRRQGVLIDRPKRRELGRKILHDIVTSENFKQNMKDVHAGW